MQVSAILDAKGHDVKSVGHNTPISVALHRMAATGVGCLVVLRTDGRLAGLLSEREVIRGLDRHNSGFLRLHVHDIADHEPATCRHDDDVNDVMLRMTQRRQRHLPVLDPDDRVVGLVSLGDVVKSRIDDLELQTSVLRDAYLAHR